MEVGLKKKMHGLNRNWIHDSYHCLSTANSWLKC